jgi:hypothetical protein
MSEYKSPWSVAQQHPIAIDENDPRINTDASYGKTAARIGRDIEIITQNKSAPITLAPYVPPEA